MAVSKDPQSFLPLPHNSLAILLALLEGEAHGYGIKRSIEAQAGGNTRVRAGTLYEALSRLAGAGLIHESEERPDDAGGTSRWRYYRISELGEQVLRTELRRLSSLVGYAREHDFVIEPEST